MHEAEIVPVVAVSSTPALLLDENENFAARQGQLYNSDVWTAIGFDCIAE